MDSQTQAGLHIIPEGYAPKLDLLQTQQAIAIIKEVFPRELRNNLNVLRVSAPLFVRQRTGLNDDLNGVERKVTFDTKEEPNEQVEVVQSLAKWKRMAAHRYGIQPGHGLYTDMNAIRRDEDTDNLHSIYVDQWDWEVVITKQQRTLDFLMETAAKIHAALYETQTALHAEYANLVNDIFPQQLTFVTTQELEDLYPELQPSEREAAFARKHKAVFIMQVGGKLKSGERHDGRAPDYDDWQLNGDLVYYFKTLDTSFELSSMGIRVDADALRRQLDEAGCPERASLPFHKRLLNGELPLTMGGGIGQSRMSMLLLKKAHIGEVQCGVWPDGVVDYFAQNGITLL